MKSCTAKSQLDEFRGLCQLFQDSVLLSRYHGWAEVMKSSGRYRRFEKARSDPLSLLADGHLKGFTVRGTVLSVKSASSCRGVVGWGPSIPRSREPGEEQAGRTLRGAGPAVLWMRMKESPLLPEKSETQICMFVCKTF